MSLTPSGSLHGPGPDVVPRDWLGFRDVGGARRLGRTGTRENKGRRRDPPRRKRGLLEKVSRLVLGSRSSTGEVSQRPDLGPRNTETGLHLSILGYPSYQ